jgi:HD-GYP domain-containing protein (c-di-GMP phosphodiesterase class II)
MTKKRPYSDAISVPDALAEIRRCAGAQFAPELAELFCELIETGPQDRAAPHSAAPHAR